MTDREREAIKKMIAEFTRKICASRETARAYLVELGTHTPDGKLTRQYGGL